MADYVTYELPLTSRTRLFLKLEHLFCQSAQALQSGQYWSMQMSMAALCELLNILDRIDIKSEALQEMDRLAVYLSKMRTRGEEGLGDISKILEDLKGQQEKLRMFSAQTCEHIYGSDFLVALRQRLTSPGSALPHDFPAFHYMLQAPTEKKLENLRNWLSDLAPLSASIYQILALLRQSAGRQGEVAKQGRYQVSVQKDVHNQLIRVHLPKGCDIYPELTGNRHRVTIRFLHQAIAEGRPKPCQEDVTFELSCCGVS